MPRSKRNSTLETAASAHPFALGPCLLRAGGGVAARPHFRIRGAPSGRRSGPAPFPVAVVGCGYMGCGAISLLKMRGAYVVAIDIRRECLEDAKRIGADEVYTPDELPAHYYYVVGSGLTFEGEPGGFTTVMEWGETAESLDLAINITRMCGQLCIGAYHTGGKRLVDVQQLKVKAIDCLSTHPREQDMNRTGCERAIKMLSDGSWNFKGLPTKIYPVALFDTAHAELEEKYGRYMKALVDFERADFEPYIINEI